MKRIYFVICSIATIFLTASIGWSVESQKSPSLLNLEELILRTLQVHPELKALEKEAEAVQDRSQAARSWEDPEVGVRFYQVPFGKGLDAAGDIDYILSQKIPFPGKRKTDSEIIYHEYLHHLENLNARGRSLLKEIKTTYYELYSIQKQIGANRKNESLLNGMFQNSLGLVSTNQVSSDGPILIQTEISKLIIDRERLKQKEKILISKIKQWLKMDENDFSFKLPTKLEIPQTLLSEDQLIEIALLRHPNIKMAEHKIDQKKKEIQAAKQEYLPDFSTQLEYVQRPGADSNAWTGEFKMNIPLWVKKKKMSVAQAEAEWVSAKYNHIATQKQIEILVKEKLSSLKAKQQSLLLNQNRLQPQLRQAIEVSAASYLTSKGNLSNYLEAIKGLIDAENEYWNFYSERAQQIFELEESMGASFEEMKELKNEK